MSEEKMMILNMVKEGIITAEEGVKLLEALEIQSDAAQETRSGASKIKEGVAEVVNDVGQKINENVNKETVEGWGASISSAFSNLFSGFKDFGTFATGTTEKVESKLEMDLSEIETPSIEFHSTNGSILLKTAPVDQAELNVVCRYKPNKFKEGEKLFDFFLRDNILHFIPEKKEISIHVEGVLPNKRYQNVNVFSSNGEIDLDAFQADRLFASSSNARIKVNQSEADTFDLNTTNARIITTSCSGEKLMASSSNGRIIVEECSMKDLNLTTSNGRIAISEITAENLETKTSNGTIEIDSIASQNIIAETSNGKIQLGSINTEQLKNVRLRTSNGSIHAAVIPLNKEAKFKLSTSNGNLSIDRERLIYDVNKQENRGSKRIEAETEGYREAEDRLNIEASTNNASIRLTQY